LKEQIVPAIDSKELMIPLFIRIIGPKAIQQQMSTIAQATTHTRPMLHNAPNPRASTPTSIFFPMDCDEKPYPERDID
jgi:hypothetical protein